MKKIFLDNSRSDEIGIASHEKGWTLFISCGPEDDWESAQMEINLEDLIRIGGSMISFAIQNGVLSTEEEG